MGLSDSIFMLDTMRFQKDFEIARETGNELIVKVKADQPRLLRHCEHVAATATPVAIDDSRDLARNRLEDWRVEVFAPAPPPMTTNGGR